jgi:hypothetical protein
VSAGPLPGVRDLAAPFAAGATLSAAQLNRLVTNVNRGHGGAESPRQVPGRWPVGLIVQANVVEQGGDWIKVLTWDGATEGTTEIVVAKPYLLRRSITSWNGISYTYTSDSERTATKSPDSETQVIVPAYVADDILYIVRVSQFGTDVDDPDGNPVYWLDLNVDGRAWAKKAT